MMSLPIPNEVEGKDKSKSIYGTESDEDGALMMCTGPTAIFGDGQEWRAFRTKRYTYAVFKSDGKEFLFDDWQDPYQMKNLICDPKYQEIASELKAQMYKKMHAINDNFQNNTWYEKNWIKDRIILKTATLNPE